MTTIRELTGEAPYLEKLVVWFAFVGAPLALLASCILASIAFRWWALLVIPGCVTAWLVYKAGSSRAGAGITLVSLAFAAGVAAFFAGFFPSRIIALFVIFLVFALWCERLLYCAATFFLRGFVLRNFRAFTNFSGGSRVVASRRGG